MTASHCPFSDPHRLFADLAAVRSEPGLVASEVLEGRVVARYEDVVAALHRPDLFSSAPTVPQFPSPWREMFAGRVPERGTLLGLDDPDHDRLRSAVNTFFMPRRLARYEPWIEAAAHEAVDAFAATGSADLKRAFGLPLALRTIAHVVGLDDARSDWIGYALSFFLGPRDVHHPGTPEDKAAALLELHDHCLAVMAERRDDRRDDLISHVWDVRDSGEVELTDFEMLSLFPGLMLAGHETSSNLICMAVASLLSRDGAWDAAQHDDGSRARALEELLRFESAITGMPRLVTRDTVLGGTELRAGQQVFLAYQAGSRDPAVFDAPDDLRLDRRFERPHLGFGQGVHACLGAPLARLLLRVELRVLDERLPGLRLDVPADAVPYAPVGAGRAVEALPIAWDPAAASGGRRATRTAVAPPGDLRVRVVAKHAPAADVVELELEAAEGSMPAWQPGAHVDVQFAEGLTRQYSLCGSPAEHLRWRIAIRREASGRGGSAHAHDRLAVGDLVSVRGPRNNFGLVDAPEYLFVAGGIGITPLLPMIEEVQGRRARWRLLYLGRSRRTMPYAERLEAAYGDRVTIWPSEGQGRIDLAEQLAAVGHGGAVYCCGPELLLVAVEELGAARGLPVHAERFAQRPYGAVVDAEFQVLLARSGRTVTVAADESVLDAVNRAGASVLSTCREGTCGSCEVRVLAGTPEHRDSVLSAEERRESRFMMTCISRALGPSLTLDL